MKAIELENLRIHCDDCGHEFPGNPPDWHNKACPKCDFSPIISDYDMGVWRGAHAVYDIINAVVGEVPDDTPFEVLVFDSSASQPLRRK